MKAFLDTSVLIAAFYGDHEHHAASLDLLVRYGRRNVCCAAHSLTEVYAVLTGMPGRLGVGADTALLYITSIRERMTLISLDDQEYLQTIEEMAAKARVAGGAIYDAVIGYCARKSLADTIYSWNTKDYEGLHPAIDSRLKRPDQPSDSP